MDADTSLTYHRFFMSPPLSAPVRRSRSIVLIFAGRSRSRLGCATSDEDDQARHLLSHGQAELRERSGRAEGRKLSARRQKYFQFVKQKYPFSKYAVLAELALADTQFARGNYTEAIDSYKSFARLHPTHEKVEDGYVAFRICESYYKDMPDDMWLCRRPTRRISRR